MRRRPHIVAIEQPVHLLRRQRDHILLQQTRPVKLLIALDLLPPHRKAVAIPAKNLQRVKRRPMNTYSACAANGSCCIPSRTSAASPFLPASCRSARGAGTPSHPRRGASCRLSRHQRRHPETSGKLAHSIVQPEGWRIRHAVAAAAALPALPMRTGANPGSLGLPRPGAARQSRPCGSIPA
jgi:hypothetical protein